MEGSLSPKFVTTGRRDDDQQSTCDRIRVDGEREHHGVYEGEYQRGPVGIGVFFV